MEDKYCLPIIKSSQTEVISEIKTNDANYGSFEIWLDYIEDLDSKFISTLLSSYPGRLVFVFRRKNLEKPRLNNIDQMKIIENIEGKNCLVDMDVYDQQQLISETQDLDLKRIISYHNYEKTPDKEELNKILDDINSGKPDVFKISTFCNDKSDAMLLLEILNQLKGQGKKYIILGMGQEGVITRLYGALLGNELTFITEKKQDSSAPGQLTRQEFEKLFKEEFNGG